MKVLTVALTVISMGLAATTTHLWRELEAERQRLAEAKSAFEQERTSRARPDARQMSEQPEEDGAAAGALGAGGAPGGPAMDAPEAAPEAGPPPGPGQRRERMSPPPREVTRLFVRAGVKRDYSAFIKDAGLNKEQTETLMNALADQQASEQELFDRMRREGRMNREALTTARVDLQTQTQAQVASLLGSGTAQQLADYQATLSERREVARVSELFGGSSIPLTERQEEQLVAVMTEEKASFPEPKWSWDDPNALQARREWQEQYNNRVLARAGSVLTSEQHRLWSEIQSWQSNSRGGRRLRGS